MYCMYSTALVCEETFAKTTFAVVSCAVPGLIEFYSPVAFIWQQTSVCDIPGGHLQGSKLVIVKTFSQSRSLFLKL